MKKALFIVAVATLFLFSCEKEKAISTQGAKSFAFQASIEEFTAPAKADINGSYQFLWAADDKIGIFVNDNEWVDKNQPFHLDGPSGSSSGSFSWDWGNFTNTNATVAFFPWQGTNSTDNNVYNGTLYIKLPNAYYNYTSGQMLTPLVAPISRTGAAYDPIAFKHAGAAVQVTINNLPAGAHSIGMTVDGQQVFGNYQIDPAAAGTVTMSLDGDANLSNNTVWLNYDPSSSERPFTFVFPTPGLTNPKLSFQMWDENGIIVWEKHLKAQTVTLGHGDILVMPAIEILPYSQFNTINSLGVRGKINGVTDWDAALYSMVTDGTISIAKGITFLAGDEFKVTDGTNWYPAGDNVSIAVAGIYDIIYNPSADPVVQAVTSKCPYPSASGFGKGSDLTSPKDITSDAWSNYFN